MRYRIATSADLGTLARMRWDFRAEDGEAPHEQLASFVERYVRVVGDEMRGGRLTYFVAEGESGLAAHMAVVRVLGIPRPSRASDQWGYLTDCYTRPSARGGGVGTALLHYACEWARSQDLELLLVSPSDAAAPFYGRAGFGDASFFRQLVLRAFDAEPSNDVPSPLPMRLS